MGHQYIPYREIAKNLNIPSGDMVLLTSDVLKLAMKARKIEKEFNADAFLQGFSEQVGEEGTLLLPAYNFDLEDGDPFSILATEPMTGSLAVAAMKNTAFQRTSHPFHSFLVRGKESHALTAMANVSSFGMDSPFSMLMEKNALMVFAGTTPAEAMTFTHFVEESEKVWYRKYRRFNIQYTDKKGDASAKVFKLYAKKPGWTMHLEGLSRILSDEQLKQFEINGTSYFCIRCRDAYEAISNDIRKNNAASIAGFSMKLYARDILKDGLRRFNLFRTTHGKIRSAKRIY